MLYIIIKKKVITIFLLKELFKIILI